MNELEKTEPPVDTDAAIAEIRAERDVEIADIAAERDVEIAKILAETAKPSEENPAENQEDDDTWLANELAALAAQSVALATRLEMVENQIRALNNLTVELSAQLATATGLLEALTPPLPSALEATPPPEPETEAETESGVEDGPKAKPARHAPPEQEPRRKRVLL